MFQKTPNLSLGLLVAKNQQKTNETWGNFLTKCHSGRFLTLAHFSPDQFGIPDLGSEAAAEFDALLPTFLDKAFKGEL
jgi:hypothetical protein